MFDYRFVWCLEHNRIIAAEEAVKVMSTAYKLTERGIFPYGVCAGACMQQPDIDPMLNRQYSQPLPIG